VFKKIQPSNWAVVRTFCEEAPHTKQQFTAFVKKCIEGDSNFTAVPPEKNMFLYKGDTGYDRATKQETPATDQKELVEWITEIVPTEKKEMAESSANVDAVALLTENKKPFLTKYVEEVKTKALTKQSTEFAERLANAEARYKAAEKAAEASSVPDIIKNIA
jgi:hypothetical protein